MHDLVVSSPDQPHIRSPLADGCTKIPLAAVGAQEDDGRRYPKRDRVMLLLSIRAGLRAKEIAMAKWSMVTDAEGHVGDALHLPNKASEARAVVAHRSGFAPNCATPWWRCRSVR